VSSEQKESVPQGRSENSPAIHRWDQPLIFSMSPGGTAEQDGDVTGEIEDRLCGFAAAHCGKPMAYRESPF
jgi:hypothetical protein